VEKADDDATGCELVWTFLLLVEEHAKKGRKQSGLNLGQLVER